MADTILFNIAEAIISNLGSSALKEIGLLCGVKNDLRKLKTTMTTINAVLLDAEQKQTQYDQVRNWLQNLQDVVYDADNLVDEFHTEALRRKVMPGNTMQKQVCIFFSSSNQLVFRLKLSHKIKEIREALDEIKEDKIFFTLDGHSKLETQLVPTIARETHSYVSEEEVIGRGDDKKAILRHLMDETIENVSTVAIVGLGGFGKTTLAQFVYNDDKVQKHFDLRLWVCVSEVFDLKLIVGKIIKAACDKSIDQNLELEQFQSHLRREINGKKYFLVLDDVWNEDSTEWDRLISLLMGGARGSRVLVTTRSKMVARVTRPFVQYDLEGLDEDKSWSLFEKKAFGPKQDFEKSDVMAIGMEIVKKCKGVPLAIKSIGSILYFKNSKSEWVSFKDNELAEAIQQEDNIIPTLKLSYNNLPSYLKHCFAYCRLFPKDHVFDVQMLITLWMAQGFIKADQNQSLEDIGYGYFLDLLRRSFFQEAEKDDLGNNVTCKMHDLMHDLASSVAGNGSVLINKDSTNFGENLVHVSFDFSLDTTTFLKSVSPLLNHHYKLRTLFCFSKQDWKNDLALTNCMEGCLKFKLLRALDLNRFSFMKKLPNSFGEYKHLRYLNLSKFREIEKLPDSITKLQNLQTLNLSECESLSSLPRDMHKMVSLRHLLLDGCSSLSHMPRRLGELTCLHTLSRFVLPAGHHVKHSSIGGVGELRNLNSLRGNLVICNLRPDIVESSETANLQEKQHLQKLKLHYLEYFEEDDDEKYEKSLELLQPHPNLKVLRVKGYMGVGFASWVKSLINLVQLKIVECPNLTSLPEAIGNLSSLQSLVINECPNLTSLPEAIGNLSSLQSLSIFDCPNLTSLPEAIGNLSSLQSLLINECPNLTSLPEAIGNLSSLQTLVIWRCSNLISLPEAIGNLSSLQYLKIWSCSNLTSFPEAIGNLSSLQSLDISKCPNLTSLPEAIGNLSSLQSLDICKCPNLTSLPEAIGNLSPLQSLDICKCPNLTSLPEAIGNLSSLQRLPIWSCSKLTSLPKAIGNLSSLQYLRMEDCPNLTSLPEAIGNLSSLQTLVIWRCSNLTSLPEAIGNLSSLQTLKIWSCSNLTSLPEAIGNLSSLQTFHIMDCPNLTSLPEVQMTRSLRRLNIKGCPILQKKCSKASGEDWPKIAHIPDVEIE